MSKKIISLVIGSTIFILIVCAGYIQGNDRTIGNTINKNSEFGDIVHKGKFPLPVENFLMVTSGFGNREANRCCDSTSLWNRSIWDKKQ